MGLTDLHDSQAHEIEHLMSENLLTSEGLITVPGCSKASEEENMDTSNNFEDDLLGQSEEDEIPPCQAPNDTSHRKQKQAARQSKTDSSRTNENPRKRRRSQPRQPEKSAENKIFHAEAAIKSLKRRIDKGTCPETLQYRARANIRVDNEFITDVKRLRKKAEQELVKALTRFHYREIDRARVEITKSKRPKVVQTATKNEKCNNPARSAPAECNTDVTLSNVKEIAGNIQASIAQFGKMMEKLGEIENKQVKKYKCVFSDSHHNTGAKNNAKSRHKENAKSTLTNKKRKERRKLKQKKQ